MNIRSGPTEQPSYNCNPDDYFGGIAGGGPARRAGARTPAQLVNNLGALEVRIPDDALASLEEPSAIQLGFPREFLALSTTRNNMFGDIKLETGLTAWQLKPSPALDAVKTRKQNRR